MSLPSGIIELEYIQSSGTQYVDTGIRVNATDTMRCNIVQTITPPSSGTLEGADCYMQIGLTPNGYGGVYRETALAPYGNKDAISVIFLNKVETVYINGTAIDSWDWNGTTISNVTLGLLKLGAANGSWYTSPAVAAKTYSCQIYDNGVLVRDYIPCKLSDGTVGLWDDANGQFYGNAGSGVFVAGPASEIVELEYIESSGTQYIDTGFKPNQDSRIVLTMELDSSMTGSRAFFGARDAGAVNGFALLSGGSQYQFDYNKTQAIALADINFNKSEYDINRNVFKLNGTTLHTESTGVFSCSYPAYLFTVNNGGNPHSVGCVIAKLYSCQIYDNGLLVRDYVAAKTIEGEVGLYDRVFHEFYRNAGTGVFTAGPEMEHEGYIELEYVESSGSQYVDTLFKPNQNTRVVAEMAYVSHTDATCGLFGCRSTSSWPAFESYYYKSEFYFAYGTKNNQKAGSLSVGQRMRIDFSKSSATYDVGGSVIDVTPSAAETFTVPSTMTIHALHRSGVQFHSVSRTYSFQIYDNGTLVRIYIPMLHPSGVPGLWDAVNERFYASASTTDLLAGPVVVKAPEAPENFRQTGQTLTTISLAWDSVANADTYYLYRNGTLVGVTDATAFTDTGLKRGVEYTYGVSAAKNGAIGDAATIRAGTQYELWLVTDRTQDDVAARNEKGVYGVADLNRVGDAMNYIAGVFTEQGYIVEISPRTDWKESEWPTPASMAHYLDCLATLRGMIAVYKNTPLAPGSMEKLRYSTANEIEMILVDIDWLLNHIYAAYRHCGVTICGEGGLIL